MRIISISGLDGSGKSTQSKMLKKHFESQGRKVFYFHAVQFSIAQMFKDLLVDKKSRPNAEKGVISATKWQLRLRKIAFRIDVMRFKFLVKKLIRQKYDYIISDRFFYDNVVNITYLMRKNFPPHIEKYMPPSDFAFYLKMEPEEIMKRRRIPDQGFNYLKKKKFLYDACASMWGLKTIDANMPKEQVFEKILGEIDK